ncbi:PqiC family protein [Rubellimicrobium arenae]|uniref:PqiC family protein n=1 Tax=Rubellimicrobium arenae TaxID=2817372 RepID=UPI001B309E37|nr:ABC-type transport auxiliary lipoprotein family protein [Rubellimicrobium arenae]
MTLRPLSIAALVLLAACGPQSLRLAVPPAEPPARVGSSFGTVELLDVSLPEYAAADDVYVQVPGNSLTQLRRVRWADDPARAETLDLARALGGVTGARVVPEPWPFEEPAEAQVDVRVAEMVADSSGAFLMRGQYYVASQDGSGRDRAREFRIRIPLPADPGPGAIAAARGQATLALAQDIAANGLR